MGIITGPLHVGISVYHMDEAVQWYRDNLDFEPVSDAYVPPLKARIVFLRHGDFEIELFQYDEPKALPEDRLDPNTDLQTVGTKHVAFAVTDMAAAKAKLLANHVEIAHEVVMEGEPVMFIRDNSGVLIELIQKT